MSDNYTAEEVEEAVESHPDFESWSEVGRSSMWGMSEVVLRGETRVVKQVAGKLPCEGGGENIDVVIQIGDQFFKKTGWYASYDGSNWDGALREVRPIDRVVTFYE